MCSRLARLACVGIRDVTKSYETAGLAPQRSSGLRGPVAGVCGMPRYSSRYEVRRYRRAVKKKLGDGARASGANRSNPINYTAPRRTVGPQPDHVAPMQDAHFG